MSIIIFLWINQNEIQKIIKLTEINVCSQFLLTLRSNVYSKFNQNHRATGDGATTLDASLWIFCRESSSQYRMEDRMRKRTRIDRTIRGSMELAVFHARYRFLHRDKQLNEERKRERERDRQKVERKRQQVRSVNGVIIIILLSLKSEKWRADQSAYASSEFQLTAGGGSDEYSDLPYSLYLLQRYSPLSLSLSLFLFPSYSSLLSYLILGVENKFFLPFFFRFLFEISR